MSSNVKRNGIYVEEMNANSSDESGAWKSHLANLSTTDTVQVLKKKIAEQLGTPNIWKNLVVFNGAIELSNCMLTLHL
jgi:hypothetical protein